MIGTSDDKILEHFKELFPPKIEKYLLEIDGIDAGGPRYNPVI